jgi:hypothetical protein
MTKQSTIRVAATHVDTMGGDVSGLVFQKNTAFYEVTVTAAGYVDLCFLPAGTLITEVHAQIETALNGSGTIDVGTSGSGGEADLIANSEWTETVADEIASSLETTAPGGLYIPEEVNLRVTAGGAPTAGVVRLTLTYFNFDLMESEFGFHREVVIS